MAHLSELVLTRKLRDPLAPKGLDTHNLQQRLKYIDSRERRGHQDWINQGTALLRKSAARLPKSLTVIWRVRDGERGTAGRHEPFRVYHTISVVL